MGPRILAFRTAVVVDRLPPSSEVCPLSLRDLLAAPVQDRRILPMVRAPIAGVARAALVAAREADAVIGLSLPPGTPPETWFEAVAQAADEQASGLPFFLSSEVALDGSGGAEIERAESEAFKLVDAGITHLVIDVRRLPAAERATAFAAVAAPALERGACVDCVVDLDASPRALLDQLEGAGSPVDVVSVRCPDAAGAKEARAQVIKLVKLCADLRGVPVLRRGAVSGPLLDELARSPVRGCEDGGAAAVAGLTVIPWERLQEQESEARSPALARAAEELSIDAADRLEARAYVEVASLIDRLGAAGSALDLTASLEQLLEAR